MFINILHVRIITRLTLFLVQNVFFLTLCDCRLMFMKIAHYTCQTTLTSAVALTFTDLYKSVPLFEDF